MIPTAGRSDITFQPGEVRIFSTNDEILHGVRLIDAADAMTSRHFFATPGYQPVQDSGRGVLRGLKNRVNPGTGSGELTFALRLAGEKAMAGVAVHGSARPALGADTIVVLDGDILCKPTDREDARTMLGRLSGATHEVFSAVAVHRPGGEMRRVLNRTRGTVAPIPLIPRSRFR